MKFTIRHDLNNLIIREMKTSHFYLIGLFFNSLKKKYMVTFCIYSTLFKPGNMYVFNFGLFNSC